MSPGLTSQVAQMFDTSKVTRQNAYGKRQEPRAVGCDQVTVTPTTGRLGAQTASAALRATTDNFSFPLGLLLPQAERTPDKLLFPCVLVWETNPDFTATCAKTNLFCRNNR